MIETEILVIGGGIAGASTAFHLVPHHEVTLVERGEIAGAASGVNAGSISVLGWGDSPDLQSYLTAGSLEIFKALALDLGHDIALRQSGALRAIHTEAQYAFIRDRVLGLRARGYRAELLSPREARGLEPATNPALLGFMYLPLSAQADPRQATRAFATAAERGGARVLTGCEVTAIRERGDRTYHVVTTTGEVIATTLVIAAGAWSATIGAMLGLHIAVVPVRGQMWATAPAPPTVFHTISSSESSFDWSRERAPEDEPPELTHRHGARVTRHLYGRQTRSGEIIFGGDRQLVGYSTEPEKAGIEVNRAHAAEVIPRLRELPVARTWAGLMPFSMDGAPIIGRVPQRRNLYIVAGLASSGFGRGPMAGRLLAEYVHTGHRPHVLAEADPARCVTVRPAAAASTSPPRAREAAPTFAEIRPGLRSEREFTVSERMVTRHVGVGGGVLTTPSMIGLMEDTAQHVTQPILPPDHTTVGFEVAVRHLAPTPVGGRVTVCAELLEVSGRKLLFRVEARSEGRMIGAGTHRRTIIPLGSLDRPSH